MGQHGTWWVSITLNQKMWAAGVLDAFTDKQDAQAAWGH